MNEALHILIKFKPTKIIQSNHVITHLSLKDEKPIELFRSSKWIMKQIQAKKNKNQLVK